MTSKQRALLRSKASTEEAIFQIGKGGISENMLNSISDALDKREMVKLTVLRNCEDEQDQLMQELCQKLSAEQVCTIGNKIVIYRFSKQLKEHLLS